MSISKIACYQSFGQTQNRKNKINYVKMTGYGALVSGVFCALSAKKRKRHKMFALAAGLLSVFHIAILEYYKSKVK